MRAATPARRRRRPAQRSPDLRHVRRSGAVHSRCSRPHVSRLAAGCITAPPRCSASTRCPRGPDRLPERHLACRRPYLRPSGQRSSPKRGLPVDSSVVFVDCPAYRDRHGTIRCGLPAEVEERYTMTSTDGPLESARIRCPRGHFFNGPIDAFYWESQPPARSVSPGRATSRETNGH